MGCLSSKEGGAANPNGVPPRSGSTASQQTNDGKGGHKNAPASSGKLGAAKQRKSVADIKVTLGVKELRATYVIHKKMLGEGAFGQVFKAENK